MALCVDALHRYPVKGLSPERVPEAELVRGAYFPGDRLFAIENGPSGFDAARPEHQPKIKFLMLMRNERLARLRTRYHEEDQILVVEQAGREVVRADIATREGRRAVEAFFSHIMPDELRGAPKLLSAPDGFRFTDSRRGFVSVLNLASVAAIGDLVGRAVDPLRFRANLHLGGLEPWAEFDLLERVLRTRSGARLRITNRIGRCAATNVDPATGARDLAIPNALMAAYGHSDCGVYAEVVEGGAVREGDHLEVEPPAGGAGKQKGGPRPPSSAPA